MLMECQTSRVMSRKLCFSLTFLFADLAGASWFLMFLGDHVVDASRARNGFEMVRK
jgi:hypothetical protein